MPSSSSSSSSRRKRSRPDDDDDHHHHDDGGDGHHSRHHRSSRHHSSSSHSSSHHHHSSSSSHGGSSSSSSSSKRNGSSSTSTTTEPRRKRKSRFSAAPPEAAPAGASVAAALQQQQQQLPHAAALPLPVPSAAAAGAGAGAAGGMTAAEAAKAAVVAQAKAALLASQQLFGAQILGLAAPVTAARNAAKKVQIAAPVLRLDAQGREIDADGNLITLPKKRPVSTLRVNRLAGRNPYLEGGDDESVGGAGGGAGSGAGAGAAAAGGGGGQQYDDVGFDPNLRVSSRSKRRMKSLNFVDPGTYKERAAVERAQQARRAAFEARRAPGTRLNPEQHGDAAVAAGAMDVLPAALAPPIHTKLPDVEWWDAEFLPEELRTARAEARKKRRSKPHAEYSQCDIANSVTFSRGLVQIPIPVQPIAPEEAPKAIPLMLTKKEQKRIRRQNRAARLKEKQDKIAYGLMEDDGPKVNTKNMMRVDEQAGVLDPTAYEREVKTKVGRRIMNHEMRNLANKLTPAERKAKKRSKLLKQAREGLEVALFRVRDLSNKQHQYKVDVNAQQTFMSGCVLLCPDAPWNLVVVEGGTKAVKKFCNLMTRRIKWTEVRHEESDDEDEEGVDDEAAAAKAKAKAAAAAARAANKAELVWKGIVASKAFDGFRFESCATPAAARQLMASRGVPHYWDMVVTGASTTS